MKKIIFSTSIDRSGSGIFCNEDFSEPLFVAVNHSAGSSNYSFYIDGSATFNGRSNPNVSVVWEELASYLGASHILPVGQSQIKKWFGKEVYNEKLKEFKYNISEEKRKAAEHNKIKKKTQSGGLWLKSGNGKGYWN